MKKFCATLCVVAAISMAAQSSHELVLPSIPSTLTVPSQRADFLAFHYWDNMDFGNTELLKDEQFIEQNFATYVSVFPIATPDSLTKAVGNLLDKLSEIPEAYKTICNTAEKYLYEPQSPVYNEEYYLLFLNNIIGNKNLTDIEKTRPRYQLDEVMKNRVGSKATDFRFEDLEGNRMSLHNIKADKDILLLFYDPDCDHCRETIDKLKKETAVTDGRVKVVAIYSGDDRDLWKTYAPNIPREWVNGFEPGEIFGEELYVFRSMPTIYLLTGDKLVLQKNMQPESMSL